MSLGIEIFRDANLAGPSVYFFHGDEARYYTVGAGGLGAVGNDAVSSLSLACVDSNSAIYLFEDFNFKGRYARWDCDGTGNVNVSYVGDDFNDITSSLLSVHRSGLELSVALGLTYREQIAGEIDTQLADFSATRNGDPIITWEMWPSFSPTRKYVVIRQRLVVDVPDWPWDYDAEFRYYVYFYLDGDGRLRGYVEWVYAWVERGIWSGKVMEQVWPLVSFDGAAAANEFLDGITNSIPLSFQALYYLPGAGASVGDVEDDITMVLVKES